MKVCQSGAKLGPHCGCKQLHEKGGSGTLSRTGTATAHQRVAPGDRPLDTFSLRQPCLPRSVLIAQAKSRAGNTLQTNNPQLHRYFPSVQSLYSPLLKH